MPARSEHAALAHQCVANMPWGEQLRLGHTHWTGEHRYAMPDQHQFRTKPICRVDLVPPLALAPPCLSPARIAVVFLTAFFCNQELSVQKHAFLSPPALRHGAQVSCTFVLTTSHHHICICATPENTRAPLALTRTPLEHFTGTPLEQKH